MDNRDKIKNLIINFSGKDNVIPIPVIYIKLLEDYHVAAFLNQLVYWSDKTKRTDGYFYKTYKEWHEELRLSRYQIDKSIAKLKELGLIETALKKANGAPTLHYKLNTDKLSTWICEKLTNGFAENSQMELRKTDKSLTESTTENTTENISMSDKSDAAPYKTIIEYLNNKVNKRFSYKSESNRKLIKARFNEGYKLEDFMKVIDIKTNEWINDDKMKNYLQPSTLFRGSNFDKYLNQELPELSNDETDNSFISELIGGSN